MLLNSTDDDINLLKRLRENLTREATCLGEFLVLLGELDETKAYARLGFSSLFSFCYEKLRLTSAESYTRVRLARLSRDVPQVIAAINSGAICPTALRILAPILSVGNFAAVIAAVEGKTIREVEAYRDALRVAENIPARTIVRTLAFQGTEGLLSGVTPGPGTSLPKASTALPHAATALPHAATSLPEAATSLPDAATSLPDAATSLPDAATSLPDAATALPHAATSLPHAATALPHAATSLTHAAAESDDLAQQLGAVETRSEKRLQKVVRVAVTLSAEAWEKYRQVCNLSNHGTGSSEVAQVLEHVFDDYIARHMPVARRIRKASLESRAESAERKDIATAAAVSVSTTANAGRVRSPSVATEPTATVPTTTVPPTPMPTATMPTTAVPPTPMPTATMPTTTMPTATMPTATRGATKRRPGRHIPIAVRSRVWHRDGGQCSYVDQRTGQRCQCRRGLQYDHIYPFSAGGDSRADSNLRLLCPIHNRIAAEFFFGKEFMRQKIATRLEES